MIEVIVPKDEENNWEEYLDINKIIKEAIRNNRMFIDITIKIKDNNGSIKKLDTSDYSLYELGISTIDFINYCHNKYKGEQNENYNNTKRTI